MGRRKNLRVEEYVPYLQDQEDLKILAQAEAIHLKRLQRLGSISDPTDCAEFLRARYAHLPHEIFAAVLVDTRHRIITICELFRGTTDGAEIHPKEIAIAALHHGASAVIFCHNHPSGNLIFSAADRAVTARCKASLATLEIRVLDHILVTSTGTLSMAQAGQL